MMVSVGIAAIYCGCKHLTTTMLGIQVCIMVFVNYRLQPTLTVIWVVDC